MKTLRVCMPVTIVLVFGLVLVACGTSTPSLTAGTYTTQVQSSSPYFSDVGGDWEIDLGADGTYALRPIGDHPGQLVTDINGHYTLAQNQIVLVDDIHHTPDPSCTPLPKGTYSFTFDGKQVSFKKVDDTCVDRIEIITLQPWIKK